MLKLRQSLERQEACSIYINGTQRESLQATDHTGRVKANRYGRSRQAMSRVIGIAFAFFTSAAFGSGEMRPIRLQRRAWKPTFLGCLSLTVFSSAVSAAPSPTPAGLPDLFISAWNAHDTKAFEALYAADAIWVPVAEERTRGRAAIVAEFAKIHTGSGWAVKTMIAKKDVPEVHVLKPGVATIFFHMDFLRDGRPVPGLQRAMILVAVRQSAVWRIAAGQLTKESPAPG